MEQVSTKIEKTNTGYKLSGNHMILFDYHWGQWTVNIEDLEQPISAKYPNLFKVVAKVELPYTEYKEEYYSILNLLKLWRWNIAHKIFNWAFGKYSHHSEPPWPQPYKFLGKMVDKYRSSQLVNHGKYFKLKTYFNG
jgi:hypothetical protein